MAFIAYLDCSGDGTDASATVVSVGGYVAHESQWAEFERRWSEALKSARVESLHMKEFAHSVGPFKDWKGEDEKRAAFLGSLIQIINDCTLQSVSVSIVMKSYWSVNELYALEEALGGAYPMALLWTVARLVDWHTRHKHIEPLMVIVERGDNDQKSFSKLVNQFGQWDIEMVTHPIFQRKQWVDAAGNRQYCLPFQAADLWAYETSKMLTDWIQKGKTTVRQSMFGLSYPPKGDEADRLMMQFNTATAIKALAKKIGVLRRFNIPIESRASVPLEPLCYLDMERPLICEAAPLPSAKVRRHAMRGARAQRPHEVVLRHKSPAQARTAEPSESS